MTAADVRARAMEPEPVALVLSGAAAHGAYQIGVLEHLFTAVADDLARPLTFEIISGTSAGAINAAALASDVDVPLAAVERLADLWTGMVLDRVLRPSAVELLAMLADVGGAPTRIGRALGVLGARGGLLGRGPLEHMCAKAARPSWIEDHLAAGHLRALAIVATEVSTGRARVFHSGIAAPRTHAGPSMVRTSITTPHVMASAAVPVLFPAVEIDDELYCDGGLRQVVPLSPALHLGARRVLMITATSASVADPDLASARRAAAGSPLYLAGKALDALFDEGIEGDLDRLLQINHLLEAGRRRFGPTFVAGLDRELTAMGSPPVQHIDIVHVRPSRDLATIAAEYVAGPDSGRWLRGPIGRTVRRLVDRDPVRAGGLLSYVLFDGGFAERLIALGRSDARAQHAALRHVAGHTSASAGR